MPCSLWCLLRLICLLGTLSVLSTSLCFDLSGEDDRQRAKKRNAIPRGRYFKMPAFDFFVEKPKNTRDVARCGMFLSELGIMAGTKSLLYELYTHKTSSRLGGGRPQATLQQVPPIISKYFVSRPADVRVPYLRSRRK